VMLYLPAKRGDNPARLFGCRDSQGWIGTIPPNQNLAESKDGSYADSELIREATG
jgi:hypothetical protein